MLIYTEGNIFNTPCESILFPVNCDGILLTSLLRDFDSNFPQVIEEYRSLCKDKMVILGNVFVHKVQNPTTIKNIITYAFRKKWEGKVPEYWTALGLGGLRDAILEYDIKSLAIPSFVCGKDVGFQFILMKSMFKDWHRLYKEDLNSVDIRVYAPFRKEAMIHEF